MYLPTSLHEQDMTLVQFLAEFNWFEFGVFLFLYQLLHQG